MSNPVQPHWWQPTRLPHPWDSPGKNTGVGCHFLLQCMKVKSESEVTQSCLTPSNPMDCSLPGSSLHGISPGKSTGVGCHCLLRYIYESVPFYYFLFMYVIPHKHYPTTCYSFAKILESVRGCSHSTFIFKLLWLSLAICTVVWISESPIKFYRMISCNFA